MSDIHMQYRIAYEAALNAQLVSLRARLAIGEKYIFNPAMLYECELVAGQIKALEAEVKHLNQ